MAKKIIYQHEFLTADIMCDGCGGTFNGALTDLDKLKKSKLLPQDAEVMIDAEPQTFGVNKLLIMVESATPWTTEKDEDITHAFKQAILENDFTLLEEEGGAGKRENKHTHRRNIAINLLVLAILIALSVALPPSLPLTISLIAFSFLVTAYTSRRYFTHFWRNIKSNQWFSMSTGVSLGWILSLCHALYHTISMPGMVGFSITFMNVSMPVMLITIVNLLEELQGAVNASTRKMQLQGMKSLFHFSATYMSYQPSAEKISPSSEEEWTPRSKSHLKTGMLIQIQRGECIPVDGKIVRGTSLVDTAILNGETKKLLSENDSVPAGSINLGQDIVIQAQANSYMSSVNRVLFRANRKQIPASASQLTVRIFPYLYGALVVIGVLGALLIPGVLGTLTVPLALQSVIGIVFAICPCTFAIAHRLPRLLMRSRLHEKGIILRNEHFLDRFDKIDTLVFDKTGTLTSGDSEVVSAADIFPPGLWQRIYLLEERYGADHPLAQSICRYYKVNFGSPPLIQTISSAMLDDKHRGLSGQVQGRHIQIGSHEYLKEAKVRCLPEIEMLPEEIQTHIQQGHSPIYVAEDGVYQGTIFVKHQVAPDILAGLKRLKKDRTHPIKLVMLTGDTQDAATCFNQQCDGVFDVIHASQKPADKETELEHLMKTSAPESLWFVCDGLNDASGARIVSEKEGVSCAMHAEDKAGFFTDIALNGSLEYLFHWQDLHRYLKRNTVQNQGLLAYGSLIFFVLLICLPIAGVSMNPVVPLVIMLSTTCMTLFNAYRTRVAVDVALAREDSWIKRLFSSDISLGILVSGIALLVLSLLVMTFASGHLVLPAFVFSAGLSVAVSSGFLLTAVILLGGFTALTFAYMMTSRFSPGKEVFTQEPPAQETMKIKKQPEVSSGTPRPLKSTTSDFFPVLRSVSPRTSLSSVSLKRGLLSFGYNYSSLPTKAQTSDKVDDQRRSGISVQV